MVGPVRSAPGSLISYRERAISGPLWVISNTHPILGRRIGGTRRGHAPGAAAGLGLGRARADALAEPTHQGVAELVAQHLDARRVVAHLLLRCRASSRVVGGLWDVGPYSI